MAGRQGGRRKPGAKKGRNSPPKKRTGSQKLPEYGEEVKESTRIKKRRVTQSPKRCIGFDSPDSDETTPSKRVRHSPEQKSPRSPTPPPKNIKKPSSREDIDRDVVTSCSQSGQYGDEGPGTPGRGYWDDPSKEEELCRLWEEEVNLYDLQHPDHRNPRARAASMRRIATILEIPCK
jgi:hypothetical protein